MLWEDRGQAVPYEGREYNPRPNLHDISPTTPAEAKAAPDAIQRQRNLIVRTIGLDPFVPGDAKFPFCLRHRILKGLVPGIGSRPYSGFVHQVKSLIG